MEPVQFEGRVYGGWSIRNIGNRRYLGIRIEDPLNGLTIVDIDIPAETVLGVLSNSMDYNSPLAEVHIQGLEQVGKARQLLTVTFPIPHYNNDTIAAKQSDIARFVADFGWALNEGPGINHHRYSQSKTGSFYSTTFIRFVEPGTDSAVEIDKVCEIWNATCHFREIEKRTEL